MELPRLNTHASLISGISPAELLGLYEQYRQELISIKKKVNDPKVLLVEANLIHFVAAFFAAVETGVAIFLGNPSWGGQEWAQVAEDLKPDLIWGDENLWGHFSSVRLPDVATRSGYIHIPTGGSSGKVRFAIHNWRTLSASAQATLSLFGENPLNACNVLPLYHVSGLMPIVRAFISKGHVLFLDLKDDLPALEEDVYVLSLVGKQLKDLLGKPEAVSWLRSFRAVFLGGGPAAASLLSEARKQNIPVGLTYGMTETASMVSLSMPDTFLSGNNSLGQQLPGMDLAITNSQGGSLSAGQSGRIQVCSESLFYGYYPQVPEFRDVLKTSDSGFMNKTGDLFVQGRVDTLIISGGEKVAPWEVEAAIMSSGEVSGVHILGQKDSQWGECVVAIYESEFVLSEEKLKIFLKERLAPYKIPKKWIRVPEVPLDEKGKLDKKALEALLS